MQGMIVTIAAITFIASSLIFGFIGASDLYTKFVPAGHQTEALLIECRQNLDDSLEQTEYLENLVIQQASSINHL